MYKKILIYAVGTVTGVSLCLGVHGYASASKEQIPVQDIRIFAEVYNQVKSFYFEDAEDSKLMENAVKGLVSGLDPHSEYMNKKELKELQNMTQGQFAGLGIEVTLEDGFVKIVSPIEDTPAFRAGLKSGDFIYKINDETTRGMSLTDAVKKMKGKAGTDITLTIVRKDQSKPIVVNLKRAIIKVNSVKSKLLEKDYAYVRVAQFQERTLIDFVDHVNKLIKENKAPLKGVVLDLRNDPGGLLNMAVGLTAAFIPRDKVVVSTKGRSGQRQMVLTSNARDYKTSFFESDPVDSLPGEIKNIPVTVLINSGSASASEIVTGALQDYARAVVVGTQSFGKGSVQSVLPLSNGGGVKLTTALYYTPNDRSIQARGIVPDLEVLSGDEIVEMREADLSNHVSNPKGSKEVKGKIHVDNNGVDQQKKKIEDKKNQEEDKNESGSKKKEDKKMISSLNYFPDPKEDPQLKAALDLVKDTSKWSQQLGQYKIKDKELEEKEKKEKEKEEVEW